MSADTSLEFSLAFDEAGDQEVLSLFDHLNDEDDLVDTVKLVHGEIQPGTLGSITTLLITIGSTGIAASVVRVLIAWLETRKSEFTIKIKKRNGEFISVVAATNGSTEDSARLFRELKKFFELDSPSEQS